MESISTQTVWRAAKAVSLFANIQEVKIERWNLGKRLERLWTGKADLKDDIYG